MSSDSPGRDTAGAIVSSCKVSAEPGDIQMIRDPSIPRLLSLAEAGEILGCSRQYVDQLIKDGRLPAARAGGRPVVAEETVLRYAAGERFAVPSMLLIYRYDRDMDRWDEIDRRAVRPEYELPGTFTLADVDGEPGREYRVELVDQHGRTLAVKPVDGA